MPSQPLKKVRAVQKQWVSPDGHELTVKTKLDEVRVQHSRNLNRSIGEVGNWPGCYYDQYASFWVWRGGLSEIMDLIAQLQKQYRQVYGRLPKLDRHYADFIKRFVASYNYQYDERSIGHKEYAKFPIEALYDQEGDCECLSFFLSSIFTVAGFETAILFGFTKPGRTGAHAAVGIAPPEYEGDHTLNCGSQEYLYCEAVSGDPVGKSGFDFSVFHADACVFPIERDYSWGGTPSAWQCSRGCGLVEPWIERCPSCGRTAVFTEGQAVGEECSDWDKTLTGFLDWLRWVQEAPCEAIGLEIEKLKSSQIWECMPSGNRGYLEKTLKALREQTAERSMAMLEGARSHLISAWPHIVASVFCHQPRRIDDNARVHAGLSWIGTSVYEMYDDILVQFTRKVLSDTTCKRIKGFSTGNRLALGRIMDGYERKGSAYLAEKRKSIENILVKVVIPQVFTLLVFCPMFCLHNNC